MLLYYRFRCDNFIYTKIDEIQLRWCIVMLPQLGCMNNIIRFSINFEKLYKIQFVSKINVTDFNLFCSPIVLYLQYLNKTNGINCIFFYRDSRMYDYRLLQSFIVTKINNEIP